MNEQDKYVPPLKAIRQKCLDCVCFQPKEVALCPSEGCPLHPYRFGKNPFNKKREYSEEQQQLMRDRMSGINKAKKYDK